MSDIIRNIDAARAGMRDKNEALGDARAEIVSQQVVIDRVALLRFNLELENKRLRAALDDIAIYTADNMWQGDMRYQRISAILQRTETAKED